MSELMSSLDLAFFPIVALLLFGAAFVAILVRTFGATRDEMSRAAGLPLHDDADVKPRGTGPSIPPDPPSTTPSMRSAAR